MSKRTHASESRVITARLSQAYKDEARALGVLDQWESKGNTRRYIVTAALLALDGARIPQPAPVEGKADTEAFRSMFADALGDLKRLAKQMADGYQQGGAHPLTSADVEQLNHDVDGIDREFKRSIYKSVRFGDEREE